jgi:putative hydrolase of the HAD superfamily
MNSKRIILFDFFGTLVGYVRDRNLMQYPETLRFLNNTCEVTQDTFLALWSQAFRETEREYAGFREFKLAAVGNAFERLLGASIDVDRLVSIYMGEWGRGISYIPELPSMLARLAGKYRMAVISNTHYPEIVHKHLELAGIRRFFEAVHTSAEFGLRKPSSAIFEHALNTAKLPAESALHVGDSYEDDFLGAQNASIDCVLIANPPREDVILQVKSIEALPTAINEVYESRS